jgi:hypothetical protein
MSNSKRAIRRHHRERLNRRTRHIITQVWSWMRSAKDEDWADNFIRRHRDNMSANRYCQCCGNPRNKKRSWLKGYDRLTLQEQRQLDSEHDQLQEVD